MTKKFVRNMSVGFCIFVLLIGITYIVCTAARRLSGNSAANNQIPIDTAAVAESESIYSASSDYYLVRYDGENLSVYSVTGTSEEFMYNLDVRIEDISEAELKRLKNGIMLSNPQELASFEEDFTS